MIILGPFRSENLFPFPPGRTATLTWKCFWIQNSARCILTSEPVWLTLQSNEPWIADTGKSREVFP